MSKVLLIALLVLLVVITSTIYGQTLSLFEKKPISQSEPARIIETLTIPPAYGEISEFYSAGQGKAQKLIIHIQDVHSHYQTQLSIAKIIERLIKEHGIDLILVEGGTKKDNLTHLREIGTQQQREKVAENFLKQGKIAAEEYMDIVSHYTFDIYGIEDRELYDENMAAFIQVDLFKKPAEEELNIIKSEIARLKQKIYPKSIIELEEAHEQFLKKAITLQEFIQFLNNSYPQFITANNFTNLNGFLEIVRLEADINFEALKEQQQRLLKELATLSSKEGVKNLFLKTAAHKNKLISDLEFYGFLERASTACGLKVSEYPFFSTYIDYLKLSQRIDETLVVDDVVLLYKDIKRSLLVTEEQKNMEVVERKIDILTSLVTLQMMPEDVFFFSDNKQEFYADKWSGLFNIDVKKTRLTKQNIDALEKFYASVFQRDDAFIRNTKKWMRQKDRDVAILIAGGFHTEAIKSRLKNEGLSYIVIKPQVGDYIDNNIYHKNLEDKWR
ncbi:MAG: hypothetical protein V2A72_02985 [Candidatus Omnitrophota bacterium]